MMSMKHTNARRASRTMILLLSITCALVGASTLSACDGGAESAESGGADPIAVVMSIRSNQQTLNPLSSTEIVSMIDAHMGGTYFMISADGVPRLVSRVDTRPTAKNDSAREYERQGFVQPILAAMLTPASTPETDLLKSLALAAGTLEGAHGDRTVLVIDSGVSTAGALAFQSTGLLAPNADVDAAVEHLRSAGALPDLTGVSIRWFGLGAVQDPQPVLDTAAISRLKDVWTKVITAAHGQVVFADYPMTEIARDDAPAVPAVTPVPVDAFELGQVPTVERSLPDTEVGFSPDTAEFRDPDAARTRIAAVAAQILQLGVTQVRTIGCTSSWGTPEHRQELSEARAAAVAELLKENGVNVTSSIGLGYECPNQIVDTESDGTPIEELMVVNRRVIVQAA